MVVVFMDNYFNFRIDIFLHAIFIIIGLFIDDKLRQSVH